jgi:hypothetical protein
VDPGSIALSNKASPFLLAHNNQNTNQNGAGYPGEPKCKFCRNYKTKPRAAYYNLANELYQIISNCVQSLSKNIMDSSVNIHITEMTNAIAEFLTDEQKQQNTDTILCISSILEDHGWNGEGFDRAPDRKHIRQLLLELIK